MIRPLRPLGAGSFICLFVVIAACGPPEGGQDTGQPLDSGVDAADTAGADAGDAGDTRTPDSSPADTGGETGTDAGSDAGMDADGGDMRSTEDYPLAQCDKLDPSRCALPWPSNLYLAPDAERETGYQLRFGQMSLPQASGASHANPKPYRRRDGYGLGSPILTHFPNVDISEMPDRYDIEPSMAEDASIVFLEVQEDGSVERVPYWVELDAQAKDNPEDQLLIVRPAVILEENTRYVIAYRNLETDGGDPIEPSAAFEQLRDDNVESGSVLAERKARFEEVFGLLEKANVARDSLTLAWDFHTASGEGLRGPMLSMRRQAIEATGQQGPELDYQPSDVAEFSRQDNSRIGLEIDATFDAPHFMESVSDSRDWVFHTDEQGNVTQNGTREAKWYMRVPQSALEGEQVGVIVYGHGLLGSRKGIDRDIWGKLANQHDYILVAANWTGMSENDRGTAIAGTRDITNFQGITDRMHQGILEFLMLARAARHRLGDLEALTERNVNVASDQVFFVGASQGGIYGQTVMALTDQMERGFLAVPGNNYSTLLQRSTNFEMFLDLMKPNYQSPAQRLICIAAMQQLWDGTDPISYAGHIEQEPLVAEAPDKDVLLAVSKGDHQVAVATNEVLARSEVGIPLMEPYDDEHQPWGAPTATYPRDESGVMLFDYGNAWPDANNLPPQMGDDPHNNLAQVDEAGTLINSFFRDEQIVDICGGSTCDF